MDIAERLAGRLARRLLALSARLVTAESCTGGALAEILTRLPGSSGWFERGFVTYSNEAKLELLHVRQETLARYGAVSEETAREMVIGAVRNSRARIGVAITGIAGPNGGLPDKPVGTVCLGWLLPGVKVRTRRVRFKGDRRAVRARACVCALEGLLAGLRRGAG